MRCDHLTVIAPSLAEGVAHVRACLGIEIPFGTRHAYMGTHNCRLQLGAGRYLEVVARDPDGRPPGRVRWFGLDDDTGVSSDWVAGRRLRGWVAATDDLDAIVAENATIFGQTVSLPFAAPEFGFSIRPDGKLPLDGAVPSLIDHRGNPTSMEDIPDLGARLTAFGVEHPDPDTLAALYDRLSLVDPPVVTEGAVLRYRAEIDTPGGPKVLT